MKLSANKIDRTVYFQVIAQCDNRKIYLEWPRFYVPPGGGKLTCLMGNIPDEFLPEGIFGAKKARMEICNQRMIYYLSSHGKISSEFIYHGIYMPCIDSINLYEIKKE